MKNNQEFKVSVFAKAAEYEKSEKAKKQKRARVACALLLCALCCSPLVLTSLGYGMAKNETPTSITTVASPIIQGTAGTSAGTEQKPAISTAASTTVSVVGVIPAVPQSLYIQNGAYTYITGDVLYEHRFISFGLNEYTAEYFDEEFFRENAVLILLINVEAGEKPCLTKLEPLGGNVFNAYVSMDQDENQGSAGTAVMMIPVPRESVLPIDAEINLEIIE